MSVMKPEPIVTASVCSCCGLPWKDHGDKPTLDVCVKLLKAALALARTPPAAMWDTPGGWRNCP